MKKALLILPFVFFIANMAIGQYSFTALGQTYTQDFETFAGTLASIPTNWTNSFNDYLPGGFYSNTGVYSNMLSTYALNQDGTSEFAIGSKIAATGGSQVLKFNAKNNIVGENITGFSVSWDAEQYSTGGRATSSDFSFSAGGTIGGTTLTTSSTGADANLASVISTNRSITITGLNITTGSTFDFIWTIATGAGSGNNAHVGIDNISIVLNTTVLPIELSSFTGKINNHFSDLDWSTLSERDNDFFSIERSRDAIRFEEIGRVNGAGDSNVPLSYSFTDHDPQAGKNYYRLRQVDFDGKFSYSKVVSVNFGNSGGITLSPMPTSDELYVSLEKPSSEAGVWQVLDMSGRVMRTDAFPAEAKGYQLSASDLPEGSYVFRLVIGQEVLVKKFRKAN